MALLTCLRDNDRTGGTIFMFSHTVHDIVEMDILDTPPLHGYWDKDGGPIKWPVQAVTIALLSCA